MLTEITFRACPFKENHELPYSNAHTDRDKTAPYFRPAHFADLISNELILIKISSYLSVQSLLAVSATSKGILSAVCSTPGVWRTIDLSKLCIGNREASMINFLRKPHVKRDCRRLVLDGSDLPHQLLHQIVLFEIPHLRSLSLLSCPWLNGGLLINLINYIRRPSAPRPLSLQYIALFGAPLFPLNEPSFYAPRIVAVAGNEIQTDLHSLQCLGKDHIDDDQRRTRWHLKAPYPNHPCVLCHTEQEVCTKCHIKKSCVGCLSFYCDNCEPHPNVHRLVT